MNEFNPDWDQMAVLVTHSQEQAAKIEQLEKQLAVQTYAADNYRRLLDESDHAYAELKDEVNKWKTSYSNAMDVNADLRAKLAERSAEYLAAHITYDKGYQAGRQDAEDAKYDEDEVLAETARYRAEVERLNAKLAEPMTEVADRFAHRMALELECVLSDGAYSNKWYKSAMQVLSEYRSAMNAIHEQQSPTFMGEPKL